MTRSASTRRATLAAAALACAGFASQASATDWTKIYIQPDEEFDVVVHDLGAAAGQTLRYTFDTPVGITQLRVELDGGTGNGDLKLHRDAPTAAPTCDSRQAGNNELCTQAWDPGKPKTPAATWYVEVPATAAFSGASLLVAYLPLFEKVDNLRDVPLAIARRGAFHVDDARAATCLQVRTGAIDHPLPETGCMPVGGQQAWHLQLRNGYRIQNTLTGRCLSAHEDDGFVEVDECNDADDRQGWNVLGGAGAHHFVVLQNLSTGTCLDFHPDARVTTLVACRIGQADMPGWTLRDFEDRIVDAMAEDGGTFSLIAGNHCIGDDASNATLASCDDRAATRRYAYTAMFDAPDRMDPFTDRFMLTSAPDKNRCIAADPAGNLVFRACDETDAAQKWITELYGTKSSEWHLRHVQQQKCLSSKNGGTAPGTPLVLGDCSVGDTTMRWRYVGL